MFVFSPWLRNERGEQTHKTVNTCLKGNLVVFDTRETILWDSSPFPISTDPELGVYLILRDNFAPHDVTHKQVVVHCVRYDLGHGR